MHIHDAPSDVTKQLPLSSPVFFEGWEHYTEQMMLEEGFGDGELPLKIAQLIAALWRDCRYVASIKMHTQGMTVDEAIALFKKYAGLAEGPARAEVLRGTVQPVISPIPSVNSCCSNYGPIFKRVTAPFQPQSFSRRLRRSWFAASTPVTPQIVGRR